MNQETPNQPEQKKEQNLWFWEKRLPTDEEIKAHKGFPSEAEETLLQEKFIQAFRQKTADFLAKKIRETDEFINSTRKVKRDISEPSRKFSENEVEQVLHYLYGIYFYNLVSGGALINENLSSNSTFKASKKNTYSTAEDGETIEKKGILSSENLDDWPIIVTNSVLRPARAAASIQFGTAYIYEEQFHNIDPKKKKKIIQKPGKFLNIGEISYKSTANTEWVLTGIEEAQHLHFSFLREKRESDIQEKLNGTIQKVFIGKGKKVETGPLPSFAERKKLLEESNKNPNFLIDYNSLLGEEFAAHIVQARYVEKYQPEVWESGYKGYDQAIRENRAKAVRKHTQK